MNRRLNLKARREQRVRERDARATLALYRLRNASAQVAKKLTEHRFLGGLSAVVGGPILRIAQTNRCRFP
jgi:hypothetical protein